MSAGGHAVLCATPSRTKKEQALRAGALLPVACDFGMPDHVLDPGRGVNSDQFDFRIFACEHAEYVVGESWTDRCDNGEIQRHASELFHALHQALALRTRDQIFIADFARRTGTMVLAKL